MAARLVKEDTVHARAEDDRENPARRIHGLEKLEGLDRGGVDDLLEGVVAREEVAPRVGAALVQAAWSDPSAPLT